MRAVLAAVVLAGCGGSGVKTESLVGSYEGRVQGKTAVITFGFDNIFEGWLDGKSADGEIDKGWIKFDYGFWSRVQATDTQITGDGVDLRRVR